MAMHAQRVITMTTDVQFDAEQCRSGQVIARRKTSKPSLQRK